MTLNDETVEGFAPVDLYQRREKIITRHVGGTYQKLRFYTGWPLLAGYFITPWLTWDDRQAVLFDLPARQFHIFGLNIWPQDLWLLGWILMIAAFGLFTITNIVGRVWCGYTCPQTVWTAVFMWIEQKTEGTRHQRIRLDQAPLSIDKFRRRGTKHTLWLGFAFLTGLTFVGYFTPVRPLAFDLATANFAAVNSWAYFWIGFFTLATYANAGWLREQVCIYMCPYARFQSAMIDRDTLIVSYKPGRGEPRGARKRGTQIDGQGDCIDCQLCVQVCPTGIDIREGLQYQCIGCAHCIDACDQIMDKMGSARGLISYTTLNALDSKDGDIRWLRPRSIGYAIVCLIIMSSFAIALLNRVPLDMDILRDRGVLYAERANGHIDNDYQLKVMNKSHTEATYTIAVVAPNWVSVKSETELAVPAGQILNVPLTLTTAVGANQTSNTTVLLELCLTTLDSCVREETRFLSPQPKTGNSTS